MKGLQRLELPILGNVGPRWHLMMNTLAFTMCFAAWMMNGVLITFLVGEGLYNWDAAQMGWLMGTPVLTGALMRLPVGALTDKYGGRIVFTLLLLASSGAMYMMSLADTYTHFLLASLLFGLAGASFAVGIAYTSVWFSKERQGLALGIFGAGNIGAAATNLGAPFLLGLLTEQGANLEGWRTLPQLYALGLLVTAVLFFLLTRHKAVELARHRTILQQLAPLKYLQVWRFGLYYFLVFGGFVALAQWLIPYYTNVYAVSLATAGLLVMMFSLPSSVIRIVGGWMSDKWGSRPVMYWLLGVTLVAIVWNIAYQANVWIFVAVVFIIGVTTGIGKAAVYKYIPDYFPRDVGVVGGLVGLLGALGGFFGPIIFGYLLQWTGVWTTSWMFLGLITLICLVWLHLAVRRGSD